MSRTSTPAPTVTASHILRVFRSAPDDDRDAGREWYARASRLACELAGIDYPPNLAELSPIDRDALNRAAAVIAVLSPVTPWSRNVQLARTAYMVAAEHVCDAAQAVRVSDALGTLGANARKAGAILAGGNPAGIVSGAKVTAFWRTIVDPADTRGVVIDRHAVDIALGRVTDDATRTRLLSRRGGYDAMSAAYVRAARILSRETGQTWRPCEVQAVTWLVWRREHAHHMARAAAWRDAGIISAA
jgi:hypothetical protein